MSVDFKGKLAVVTGAAQGIGEALSCELANLGAEVVMVDLNTIGLTVAVDTLREQGGSAHAYTCDLAIDAAVEQLGQLVLANHGT